MKLFPALFLLLVLGIGCQSTPDNNADKPEKDSLPVLSGHHYTFQKVYHTAVGDTFLIDTMYLKLHIEGSNVSGKYLWFIPQKDGKFGSISGQMHHDTITGYYSYQQEGGQYKDSVRVIILKNKAIVTQFNAPQSELTDTLYKK